MTYNFDELLSWLQTTLSQYHKAEFVADRRYNDFFWLHDRLREHYKGIIIPPLPDKTIIQSMLLLLYDSRKNYAHTNAY